MPFRWNLSRASSGAKQKRNRFIHLILPVEAVESHSWRRGVYSTDVVEHRNLKSWIAQLKDLAENPFEKLNVALAGLGGTSALHRRSITTLKAPEKVDPSRGIESTYCVLQRERIKESCSLQGEKTEWEKKRSCSTGVSQDLWGKFFLGFRDVSRELLHS